MISGKKMSKKKSPEVNRGLRVRQRTAAVTAETKRSSSISREETSVAATVTATGFYVCEFRRRS